MVKRFYDRFSQFDTISDCDRQTEGRTQDILRNHIQRYTHSIARTYTTTEYQECKGWKVVPGMQRVWSAVWLGRARWQVRSLSIVFRHWQPLLLIGRWSPAEHVTGRSSEHARTRSLRAFAVHWWPISPSWGPDPTEYRDVNNSGSCTESDFTQPTPTCIQRTTQVNPLTPTVAIWVQL